MTEERYQKTSMRLLGLVYVVIVSSFLALTVAIYTDMFSDDAMVTLHTGQVGNQMQSDADVKLRGINVGRVRSVSSNGDGVVLKLAMDPATLDRIPKNVTARLLPKTLFGERYVSLTLPDHPDGKLGAGDVINHDQSAATVEMERVLNNLLPLLQSVRPEKLSEMLTALSQALDGRGENLGKTLVQVGQYVGELNPQMPQIKEDITRFAAVADTYGDAADDFIQALSDFTVTSKTIVYQRDSLFALYETLGRASSDLTTFLGQNKNTIISLADTSQKTLELLAKYAPEYACLLTAVADFKPRVDLAFADGGLHVKGPFVYDRGKYIPGKDDPVYDDRPGPTCYGPKKVPFKPVANTQLANSLAEEQMLATVLAPALKVQPAEVPQWSSLLVGPLFRGAEVSAG
ncbi:phospholipid/cholesterol/gamma-HCH transport system substrate-binding protein [Kibdelosporangium banguiense]|uniref:Phospholipid/cholesterol/gamma-HCH transport system substrate-binding protein n=1 Tax=Kibdelosporangium banguiense TaxID=1365924 RepID=A0ABS4TM55_9PSEU|nr:MCE family protein [Kibdelosporangium banguiense]MBP2325495.1 phospholipid/cholesterol/gamma-HCH transport system substrate-binding protein [Kibdelosporangium banguiense]